MNLHLCRIGVCSMVLGLIQANMAQATMAQALQTTINDERRHVVICEPPEEGEPPAPAQHFVLPANPLRNSGQPIAIPKSSVVVKSPTQETRVPAPDTTQSAPSKMPTLLEVPREKDDPPQDAQDDAAELGNKPDSPNENLRPEETQDNTTPKPTAVTKKRVRDLQEEPELNTNPPSEAEPTPKEQDQDQDTIHREMQKNLPTSVRLSDNKPKRDPKTDEASSNAPLVLNAQQKQLKQRLETCIAYYLFRPESIIKRSPWAVMHAMLPFGVEAEVATNRGNVNAIGWMCFNGKCRTQKLFIPKGQGFTMAVGPGVQGHEGQFLAMLAQSGLPSSYPIQVGEYRGTVQDIIQYEMGGCKVKTELTFKLIALSHYLPSDHTWRTSDGVEWSIEKLVEEELAQPVNGAACGGTHRLMGLTYCVQRRREQGLPIDGAFARAEEFTEDFRRYAWTLQNPDGSFSTKWFEGRAAEPDMEKKVQTTGHILEWLIYATPQEELSDPRIVRALNFLMSNLYDKRDHDWPIGPRSHALRAMNLYDIRFFGAPMGKQRQHLATTRRTPANRR